MSDTKKTSEKIFDILGSLVADPFRRWLIVGYIIFNPDLFVLFFTSKERNLVTVAKDLDNIRIFRNNLCHFSNITNSNLNINSHLLIKYTEGLVT